MAHCRGMLLTESELGSLIHATHRSPHTLLGMHPLGDGSGVVVRAFLPDAKEVEISPTHEKKKSKIKLQKIHEAGIFEGVAQNGHKVYAYDLVVKTQQGQSWQTRDPYSFLPTLG